MAFTEGVRASADCKWIVIELGSKRGASNISGWNPNVKKS